jgi:hypothetical protein
MTVPSSISAQSPPPLSTPRLSRTEIIFTIFHNLFLDRRKLLFGSEKFWCVPIGEPPPKEAASLGVLSNIFHFVLFGQLSK